MALIEILTLQLGPAIAKSILKLWFKDEALASDVGSNVIDILKGKTADVIAQQKARRQFESIGESVAQSMLPLFEHELSGADERERIAVALAVTEALNKTPIDPTLLAQRNLEPVALARYLNESSSSIIRTLSSAQEVFFRRIVSEASRLIVDIASQLPSFTERTLSEVLKREEQLIATTSRILEEVDRIYESYQGQELRVAHFEVEYRSAVVRNLDKIELLGLDLSNASRRHRLSVAYIALVTQLIKNEVVQSGSMLQSVSVNTLLRQSSRILLTGIAGSGKTTLLQWIAVRAALQDFSSELIDWGRAIPFLVRLRQCVDTNFPAPEDFVRFIAPGIANLMPQGWVHQRLKSGKAIVLVDGVDEIPAARRSEARAWLADLVDTFPQAKYVISSRPHAVNDWALNRWEFIRADLQPMDLSALDQFVDHWHAAVRAELIDLEEIAEIEPLACDLKIALRRNRAIRKLATNPLLCAMLCALHRDRHRKLPTDRVELYEAGCAMLLDRRDSERNVPLEEYPDLSYRQKRALLEDLAYWMFINGYSVIGRDLVEERLSRLLSSMGNVSNRFGGHEVCRLFLERSSIIREPATGQIDFTHRTFQEFLAARAALDEYDIGLLVQNAHDDQWRELLILAAGLANAKVCGELIEGLINRGDKEATQRERLHLLAVACLETAVQLGPETRCKVQQRLEQLIPPKNMEEARSISSAGDLAVPLLDFRSDYSESTAAACVHALYTSQSDMAIDVLTGYINDNRDTVVSELLSGWEVLDRQVYARMIVNPLAARGGGHLNLARVSTLNGFECLSNVSDLEIMDGSTVADATPLQPLVNLKNLLLSGFRRVPVLDSIGKLIGLISLTVNDSVLLNDMRPLSALSNLRRLRLSSVWEPIGESPKPSHELETEHLVTLPFNSGLLPFAPAARRINQGRNNDECIEESAWLLQLRKLVDDYGDRFSTWYVQHAGRLAVPTRNRNRERTKTFDLYAPLQESHSVPIHDERGVILDASRLIDFYRSSRSLLLYGPPSELRSFWASELRPPAVSLMQDWAIDLSPLAALKNLQELALVNFWRLTDLQPLSELTGLIHLSLEGCVNLRDVTPLSGFNNLVNLDLSNCKQIKDFAPLTGLRHLQHLNLGECRQLEDLSPLENLTSLTTLSLRGCRRIQSIACLFNLPNLTQVDLTGIPSHLRSAWNSKRPTKI